MAEQGNMFLWLILETCRPRIISPLFRLKSLLNTLLGHLDRGHDSDGEWLWDVSSC